MLRIRGETARFPAFAALDLSRSQGLCWHRLPQGQKHLPFSTQPPPLPRRRQNRFPWLEPQATCQTALGPSGQAAKPLTAEAVWFKEQNHVVGPVGRGRGRRSPALPGASTSIPEQAVSAQNATNFLNVLWVDCLNLELFVPADERALGVWNGMTSAMGQRASRNGRQSISPPPPLWQQKDIGKTPRRSGEGRWDRRGDHPPWATTGLQRRLSSVSFGTILRARSGPEGQESCEMASRLPEERHASVNAKNTSCHSSHREPRKFPKALQSLHFLICRMLVGGGGPCLRPSLQGRGRGS